MATNSSPTLNRRLQVKTYSEHTVAELRRLCASRKVGSGVWRAGARHDDLVSALLSADGGSRPPIPPLPEPALGRKVEQAAQPAAEGGDLGKLLAVAMQPHLSTKVDEQDVVRLIGKHAQPGMDVDTLTELCITIIKDHTAPTELVIKHEATDVTTTLSRQHWKLALLTVCVEARINTYLVGMAGTGKTTAAHNIAKGLSMGFEAVSFGPMTTKADLFGYRDANGIYHDTALVRTATKGGVFLGDEMDAGNPGVTTGINMVLANGHLAIPTGMVKKHKDFVFIGCGNTIGTGANRQYVGRNQQDAATLDRFFYIEWDQDEGLEAHIAGVKGRPSPTLDLSEGGVPTPEQWLDYVQKVRKAVDKLGLRMVVSTRATEYGAKLIQYGMGRTHLENGLIWKGCDQATRDKVKGQM